MKKILILTAGFNEVHTVAARNVREAVEALDENVRTSILDLFAGGASPFNTLVSKTCVGVVQYASSVWGGSILPVENQFGSFARLQLALEKVLSENQPDCVISTHPVYGHAIQKIFRSHNQRPFRLFTIVTTASEVSPVWFRAPSDLFFVPDEATAKALVDGGVPAKSVKAFGFPVNPAYGGKVEELPLPTGDTPRRILYLVNASRKKAFKTISRLLENPGVEVTAVSGRDPELRAKLIESTAELGDRVRILGWTNQLPELLQTHHLVVSHAGAVVLPETFAARCPMIALQAESSGDEDFSSLILRHDCGAVVEKRREIVEVVQQAFDQNAARWQEWRKNLKKISRPEASLRIAELVLAAIDADRPARPATALFETVTERIMRRPAPTPGAGTPEMLLCDFHIHSNYSDGKLSVPELIDFYGERGFDCICITDHLADPKRLIGVVSEMTNLTLAQNQIGEYFSVIERERQRALRRYGMLVMTGIEFNKDGYTSKTSAHLLGIDLKDPIDASLDIPELIAKIHEQGGLAVASHPHVFKSEWGRNTLYLWENQDKFAPLLDAWEIANRENIFNDIGLKRLPFIANSDFHKPKHIYSWKTLLHCEKNYEAIKECVRRNEHVAITLYRDFPNGGKHHFRHNFAAKSDPETPAEAMQDEVVAHAA